MPVAVDHLPAEQRLLQASIDVWPDPMELNLPATQDVQIDSEICAAPAMLYLPLTQSMQTFSFVCVGPDVLYLPPTQEVQIFVDWPLSVPVDA